MKYYTGIGSRNTPHEILVLMEQIATKLANMGYTLRSGGASGADSAFEKGACKVNPELTEIYLPWRSFRDKEREFTGARYIVPNYKEVESALDMIDAFDLMGIGYSVRNIKQSVQKLHARNVYQILGTNKEHTTSMCIYYAPRDSDGNITGGTRTAVALAERYNKNTYNLYDEDIRCKLTKWLHKPIT